MYITISLHSLSPHRYTVHRYVATPFTDTSTHRLSHRGKMVRKIMLQSYGKKRNEMLQKATKLYFNKQNSLNKQNSPLLFRHQIFTPYQAKDNDVIVLVQNTQSTENFVERRTACGHIINYEDVLLAYGCTKFFVCLIAEL